MGPSEGALLMDAFQSNWIAPLGPHVDAFEREIAELVKTPHAVALSSGTAALHLALLAAGIEAGDKVWVSTLTFAASAFPITAMGAIPVFIDSDMTSWNMDPILVQEALAAAAARGDLPKALVLVHLYGQTADADPIIEACRAHGVKVIEDAAEALGASYKGRAPGTLGDIGFYSFNGNKIITTSGGGMLVTPHEGVMSRVRHLATQAREPVPHYEHKDIGFNYRLSNLLAAVGRGQLQVLSQRVGARRAVFDRYVNALGSLPGLTFQPEAMFGSPESLATRWLTCLRINPTLFGSDRETLRRHLETLNIESRPLWKPMHQQPVYKGAEAHLTGVADALFTDGMCLPSGSAMTHEEQDTVIAEIQCFHERYISAGA